MAATKTDQKIRQKLHENPGSQSLLTASMEWMNQLYDADTGLLRYPQDVNRHMVRESLWYAFGLLLESKFLDQPSNHADRIETIITQVLANQYDAPGKIWHGTFKRAPQEPDPPEDAVIWKDYDPNWRQFIGTVLILLRRLEDHLSCKHLLVQIDAAIVLCIEGEPVGRVPPTYTNIALMKAWLEVESRELTGDDFYQRGLSYADEITQIYKKHGAFAEYNSPTYYGINFYALGLWQDFSDELEVKGREISTALWTDISRYYHAGMKNVCGPWSRSYGMDMQKYVAAWGLWVWALTARNVAPFPHTTSNLEHGHDFCLGPIAAITAVAIPEKIKRHFLHFAEERQVSQQISTEPSRSAAAYLSNQLMIGLETSERSFQGTEQYHPLTIHWRDTKNGISWSRLRFNGILQGKLSGNQVDLRLAPDPSVTIATLEFSDDIQLTHNSISCNGITMSLKTSLQLNANANCLTMTLAETAAENTLLITCEIQS